MKTRLNVQEYVNGLLAGDRVVLGKAITLIESSRLEDEQLISSVLEKIIHQTGSSIRIGITGSPGVGKSTFIEAFGNHVTGLGKKIAVLTIDPSSRVTKGSILGDKTRMDELSKNELAFIRPTPSGNTLGGVSIRTRETILLCEAAGYEVIIIETVGVGQSEVTVKNMVDFFLLLMLAGAGDELQGIKKGIMEMADTIVITKSDGENVKNAAQAKAEYEHALHLSSKSATDWKPKVLTCSAMNNKGIEEIWKLVNSFQQHTISSGYFIENRAQQSVAWLHDSIDYLLKKDIQRFQNLKKELGTLERKVTEQKLSVLTASNLFLSSYYAAIRNS